MTQPFPGPVDELLNGLGLVTLGLEVGNDFEIRHRELYRYFQVFIFRLAKKPGIINDLIQREQEPMGSFMDGIPWIKTKDERK